MKLFPFILHLYTFKPGNSTHKLHNFIMQSFILLKSKLFHRIIGAVTDYKWANVDSFCLTIFFVQVHSKFDKLCTTFHILLFCITLKRIRSCTVAMQTSFKFSSFSKISEKNLDWNLTFSFRNACDSLGNIFTKNASKKLHYCKKIPNIRFMAVILWRS